jgi:hypothetical protein
MVLFGIQWLGWKTEVENHLFARLYAFCRVFFWGAKMKAPKAKIQAPKKFLENVQNLGCPTISERVFRQQKYI